MCAGVLDYVWEISKIVGLFNEKKSNWPTTEFYKIARDRIEKAEST